MDFLLQMQADQLGVPVQRPKDQETTALGAAYLAGVGSGLWKSRDELGLDVDRVFEPTMPRKEADKLFQGWRLAVSRVLTK